MALQQLEVIAFDFDGVIADTVEDIASAANDMLRQFDLPIVSVAAVRAQIGGGAEALVRGLLAGNRDVALDEAAARFRECYGRCYDERTTLFPGVPEVLEELDSAGVRMALATNKAEALTRHLVEKLGIDRYFFLIVGPESVSRRKPDPESLARILEATDVEPHRALMVGDTATDILCGRAAGTGTCGVSYGYGDATELAAVCPDFTIERFADLLDHVAPLAVQPAGA